MLGLVRGVSEVAADLEAADRSKCHWKAVERWSPACPARICLTDPIVHPAASLYLPQDMQMDCTYRMRCFDFERVLPLQDGTAAGTTTLHSPKLLCNIRMIVCRTPCMPHLNTNSHLSPASRMLVPSSTSHGPLGALACACTPGTMLALNHLRGCTEVFI